MRRGALAGALIMIAVVGVNGAVTAWASTRTSDTSTTVKIVEREWTIRLSRSRVPAGMVIFHIKNAGRVSHDLVVLKTKLTPKQLIANGRLRPMEPGRAGRTRVLKPGDTLDLKLTLKPGDYLLICSLVGHLRVGQHANLTVV